MSSPIKVHRVVQIIGTLAKALCGKSFDIAEHDSHAQMTCKVCLRILKLEGKP